ncbi:MAG: hypothetical protein JWL71_3105 [Acidobacteria bacterium]|nr:hypothetical protein [Acidobacteriota bacterium]
MRTVCVLLAFAASVHAQSAPPPAGAPAAECREYAAKLDSCSPYTCTFTHPLTGATLERQIVGLTDGRCTTVEAMPGTHKMRCEFPPEIRKAVAAFYRTIQGAERSGKTITGTATVDDNGKGRSTTTIGGKAVDNPLEDALERGTCKVGS